MATRGPLTGVRVIDLSGNLPGPLATQMLANLGAEVVKVEARGGDITRGLEPQIPVSGGSVGAFYAAINAGKRSLGIDLKSPAGRETLLSLAERADVFFESFRPAVLLKLGLGIDVLRARNPRLIVASLSGYPSVSSRADWPAHDANAMAESGALSVLGPGLPSLQLADLMAGQQSALAICAALYERTNTGCGRHITTSLCESALQLLVIHHAESMGLERRSDEIVTGQTLISGVLPCYSLYQARDGLWLALCPLEPRLWKNFCDAFNQPGWLGRSFDSSLRGELAALIATRDRSDWLGILGSSCCASAVATLEEARARQPELFSRTGPRPPWRFDGLRPEAAERWAIRPGQDSREVLQDWLNWSANDLSEGVKRAAFWD